MPALRGRPVARIPRLRRLRLDVMLDWTGFGRCRWTRPATVRAINASGKCNWAVRAGSSPGRLTRRSRAPNDTVARAKLAATGQSKRRLLRDLATLGLPVVPYPTRPWCGRSTPATPPLSGCRNGYAPSGCRPAARTHNGGRPGTPPVNRSHKPGWIILPEYDNRSVNRNTFVFTPARSTNRRNRPRPRRRPGRTG